MLTNNRKNKVGLVGLCIACLSMATLFSVNGKLHWVNLPDFGRPTDVKMGFLWLASLLFVIAAGLLSRGGRNDRVAKAFRQSLRYSDGPMCIGFGLLFLYASWLGEARIQRDGMDSFFAGAIAFQMMLSNIIWMFADNALTNPAD